MKRHLYMCTLKEPNIYGYIRVYPIYTDIYVYIGFF